MSLADHVIPCAFPMACAVCHEQASSPTKACARCGCAMTYYHLDMNPKPPPTGDAYCRVCEIREPGLMKGGTPP
jgi:hypothetical protein